jgi:hypothetical protein
MSALNQNFVLILIFLDNIQLGRSPNYLRCWLRSEKLTFCTCSRFLGIHGCNIGFYASHVIGVPDSSLRGREIAETTQQGCHLISSGLLNTKTLLDFMNFKQYVVPFPVYPTKYTLANSLFFVFFMVSIPLKSQCYQHMGYVRPCPHTSIYCWFDYYFQQVRKHNSSFTKYAPIGSHAYQKEVY